MFDTLLGFDATYLLIALVGGILPALAWLAFWLREDVLHPEPRRLLLYTFFAGALSALLSVPFEAIVYATTSESVVRFLAVALIEELCKYTAARNTALHSVSYDEPVDALIYLITAALGFAALENTLFILNGLVNKGLVTGLIVGETRIVGSTLLHIVSSALIGVSLALPFFHNKKEQRRDFRIGLILAVALHTAFNFFIIREGTQSLLGTFSAVWVLVLVLLLAFERVKRINS